jgi:hypothetical protein
MSSKAKTKLAGVVALLLITGSLASAQTTYWQTDLGNGFTFIHGSNGFNATGYDFGNGFSTINVWNPGWNPGGSYPTYPTVPYR